MKGIVLVTGAAGFVGSNLIEKLLNHQYKVIAVDNLSQGFLRNIEEFEANPLFEFHEVDVRNLSVLKKVAAPATHIAHLAAYKIPRYGNALDTLMVNSKGTEHVLEIAKEIGAKVLFSSTSDIYGKNPELPFSEESNSVIGSPSVRRWSYAISKMFDEQLCFAYRDAYDLPVTIVRYFGGYGPKQNPSWWGGPQAAFMEAILTGKTIEIHGDGKQTRTFTYIDDMVEGTFLALTNDQANGEVLNIGAGHEITILDLANLVWEVSGRVGSVDLEMIPYENFGKYEDVRRRIPDTSKAKKILGFEAKTGLAEGLHKTYEWQKKLMQQL